MLVAKGAFKLLLNMLPFLFFFYVTTEKRYSGTTVNLEFEMDFWAAIQYFIVFFGLLFEPDIDLCCFS